MFPSCRCEGEAKGQTKPFWGLPYVRPQFSVIQQQIQHEKLNQGTSAAHLGWCQNFKPANKGMREKEASLHPALFGILLDGG